jgi:hypothetical protein
VKKSLVFLLAVIMALSPLTLAACSSPAPGPGEPSATEPGNRENVWETVREAYIYVFPLVIMDATKTLSTNTEEPVPAKGKAPVNQLMHGEKLADASFKTIVTPNVDTVYSQAWYDLGDEPIVYVFPETDRFCNVQVFDAWTNTVSVFDKAGDYAIALSTWEGDLPEGVTRINVPTATAWSITRTVLSGEEDLPNVRAIQKQMKLLPLSAYVHGGEYTAPKGSYAQENDYVPVEKVLSMGPKDFFDRANELMKTNPPALSDAKMMEKLAEINVGAGMNFDLSVLSGDIETKWKEMLQILRAECSNEVTKFSVDLGQWSYFGPPIGDFGTEYTYRTAIALRGLGANTVDVALYMRTDVDHSGEMLTAGKTYVMHFETLPPTLEGGFWSVTAYGNDDFLIDNPIDRYCINDRTKFVVNDDGSLNIILSEEQPDDIANWLPVSGTDYHLFMRIYTPDMDALSTWQAPIIRVSE